jgi:stage II sporulation SpoAA-like protein
MIQIIEGLPDNVVGIVAKGRVTNEDCNKILKPLMETSLKRHDKVRLYYEIGCRFPGAAWEDLKIGMQYLPPWERVAVVTDVGWFRHSVNALRFLIPGEVRVFSTDDAYEGCAWISSPS